MMTESTVNDCSSCRNQRRNLDELEYFERFKVALEPADIARAVMFALDQPPHVQMAQMYILPVNRW